MTNNLYTPTKEQINKYKPIIEEYLTRIKNLSNEEIDNDMEALNAMNFYQFEMKYKLYLTGEQISPAQLCEIIKSLGWEFTDSDWNSHDYFQYFQKDDEEGYTRYLIIGSNCESFELWLQTKDIMSCI